MRSSTSGPAREPSRTVLVTSRRATPAAAQSLASDRRRRPGRLRPTLDRDLAVADVDRDDQPLAEPAGRRGEERGGERGRPDHDAICPGGECRRDRVLAAVAPADLERKPARRRDPLDEAERRSAAECAVEIDQVQAGGPLVTEPPGELDRVAALDRDGLPAPLREPHDASIENVDRREELELLCANTLSCYHVTNGADTNTSDSPRAAPATDQPVDLVDGIDELAVAIRTLRTTDEVTRFLRDLCTRAELEALVHRWQTARLLDEGVPYLEIAERVPTSTATVTRVAQWVRHGAGGYRIALERAGKRR